MNDQFNVIQESRFEIPGINLSGASLRYIIIFIAGVFIGYFVFGLWLFPVEYTAVYPNELRADARDDYFQMVAESYAATENLEQAAIRLRFWTQEELGPMLYQRAAALQNSDPLAAERIRALALALRLTESGALAGAETTAPPPRSFLSAESLPVVGLLILAMLILVVVILAFRYFGIPVLPVGTRAPADVETQEEELPEETAEAEDLLGTDLATWQPTPVVEQEVAPPEAEVFDEVDKPTADAEELPPWAPAEPMLEEALPEEAAEPDTLGERSWEEGPEEMLDLTQPPPVVEDMPGPAPQPEAPPAVPPKTAADLTVGITHVFVFDGDPMYDQVQPIEERDIYLGEFGIGVGEVSPDDQNQVLSLEVWLFDKSDIHTVTAILVPPEIYDDEDLRQQLTVNDDTQFIPLQRDQSLHIATERLEVEGRVRRVEFGKRIGRLPTIHYAEFELVGRPR